ncbi:hypothetical protein ACVILJ_002281 [Bradyrhizobium diazoefficiens]
MIVRSFRPSARLMRATQRLGPRSYRSIWYSLYVIMIHRRKLPQRRPLLLTETAPSHNRQGRLSARGRDAAEDGLVEGAAQDLCRPRLALFAAGEFAQSQPLLRKLLERFAGISAHRALPAFRNDVLAPPAEAVGPESGREVVLFADTFNRIYERENLDAALRVLAATSQSPELDRRSSCFTRATATALCRPAPAGSHK